MKIWHKRINMNSIAVMADEKPHEIKRKPVAAPAQAYIPPKEIAVETKEYPIRQDTVSTIYTLPPRPIPQQHGRLPPIVQRITFKWSILSRRIQICIIAGVIILLALIIGLSAGLGHKSRTSNLPLPTNHGGPYQGDLTYYDPALGACGFTNSGTDSICAVSHYIFDAVSVGSNPNANPLCGKKIRARRNGKSVDLTVVDRCTGCKPTDIDTTRGVFADMAIIDEGRVDVEWSWLEDVPSNTMGS